MGLRLDHMRRVSTQALESYASRAAHTQHSDQQLDPECMKEKKMLDRKGESLAESVAWLVAGLVALVVVSGLITLGFILIMQTIYA